MSAPTSNTVLVQGKRRVLNLQFERAPWPLRVSFEAKTPLPQVFDLTPKFTFPVYDQGQVGSCTANGSGAAYRFLDQGYPISREFIYYNERSFDGDIGQDAGSTVSTAIKVLTSVGVCSEANCPYDMNQIVTTKPPAAAYREALLHKAVRCEQVVPTLHSIKAALVSGTPVIVGIQVYSELESDEVASTGIVPMPGPDSECLGGHCVAIVGFNENTQRFKLRNSWSGSWGDHGSFYLPYEYIVDPNLTSDLWRIITEDNIVKGSIEGDKEHHTVHVDGQEIKITKTYETPQRIAKKQRV